MSIPTPIEDPSQIQDPHTRACAAALKHLSNSTDCPNTHVFSKLFLWDIIAKNQTFTTLLNTQSGNLLAMIQCALEFMETETMDEYSKYALKMINQELDYSD